MSDEVKAHYKDFFLYILILLVASFVIFFLFSKNYSETITNQVETTTVATSSATPNITLPAMKK